MSPTATASTAQKISLGAVLNVSQGGHHVTTLRTSYGLYPSQDPTLGPIGRFFNGSDESRIGLDAGLTHDIWTVVDPSLAPLQGLISQGDRLVSRALVAAENAPPAGRAAALNQFVRAARRGDRAASTQRFVTPSRGR